MSEDDKLTVPFVLFGRGQYGPYGFHRMPRTLASDPKASAGLERGIFQSSKEI